mmetsp:Transcript_44617/g.137694  ORF Transcript_44617/g.137694 Transcript_44617/m.137694 type:complete len:300 (-) Transcript_44617:462-1361(-)
MAPSLRIFACAASFCCVKSARWLCARSIVSRDSCCERWKATSFVRAATSASSCVRRSATAFSTAFSTASRRFFASSMSAVTVATSPDAAASAGVAADLSACWRSCTWCRRRSRCRAVSSSIWHAVCNCTADDCKASASARSLPTVDCRRTSSFSSAAESVDWNGVSSSALRPATVFATAADERSRTSAAALLCSIACVARARRSSAVRRSCRARSMPARPASSCELTWSISRSTPVISCSSVATAWRLASIDAFASRRPSCASFISAAAFTLERMSMNPPVMPPLRENWSPSYVMASQS